MPSAGDSPVVFVIEDPKRGDFANALALGNLIADRLHANLEVKRLALRSNALVPLLKAALRFADRGGRGPLRRVLQHLVFRGPYIGDKRPIAVVSTLGRGEAQGVFVGAFWQAPAIHLGTPKRFPPSNFAAIITHAGDEPEGAEIPLSVAPTRVKLRLRAESDPAGAIRKVCLLLGGDARGVARYGMSFWSKCVEAAIETARAHGAALTVSTSPRSGAAVEALVEAQTKAAAASLPDLELYLYGRGDRRDIVAEILSADAILVSAESVSMVSDAIASGGCVVGLYESELPTSSRVRCVLEHHCSAGTLRLEDLSQWKGGPLAFTGITPLGSCWSETLWPALAPVLVGQ